MTGSTQSLKRLPSGYHHRAKGRPMPVVGMQTTDAMLNLGMSDEVKPLFEAVKSFIAEEVDPITEEYYELGENREDRWSYGEGQLELLEKVKAKAREKGLWNFFLPNSETGEGLSNLDYAYIATELGKNPLASECLNCSAPDTGNMEVLERVGTPEQKEKWLVPLLNGEIRSAFAMTEPHVASSDAKNVSCRAELDGDEWLINGEKYYISGAGRTASSRRSWCRSTRPASRSSARCTSSVRTTRRTVTCTSSSPTCGYPRRTFCSARARASRSPSSASAPAESTTACVRSARPRRHSS